MGVDLLVWIDLETTGLDPFEDVILEIGVIVTSMELVEIDRASWVIGANNEIAKRMYEADEVVRKMHTNNDLWKDVVNSALTSKDVEEEFINFLLRQTDTFRDAALHPAGSSVHFDVNFLNAHMRRVALMLHHRHYDVSSVKMFEQTLTGEYDKGPEDPHRAIGDLENDLAWIRNLAEQWKVGNP